MPKSVASSSTSDRVLRSPRQKPGFVGRESLFDKVERLEEQLVDIRDTIEDIYHSARGEIHEQLEKNPHLMTAAAIGMGWVIGRAAPFAFSRTATKVGAFLLLRSLSAGANPLRALLKNS